MYSTTIAGGLLTEEVRTGRNTTLRIFEKLSALYGN